MSSRSLLDTWIATQDSQVVITSATVWKALKSFASDSKNIPEDLGFKIPAALVTGRRERSKSVSPVAFAPCLQHGAQGVDRRLPPRRAAHNHSPLHRGSEAGSRAQCLPDAEGRTRCSNVDEYSAFEY